MMKSRNSYRIEYAIKSLLVFREGYRFRDKLVLIPCGFFRLCSLVIISSRVLGQKANIKLERSTFPFFNLILKNKFGLFHCRKLTGDLWICQEAYELDETEYICSEIDEGLFIDIGANVGRYTIMVARKLKGHGEVIAIEPEPNNFAALVKNIELNHLTNISVVNAACIADDQDIKLFLNPHDTGGHSVTHSVSDAYLVVKGLKLDTILHNLGHRNVRWVKIDVEGATPQVLKGSTETLASSKNIQILFEHYNNDHFEQCSEILTKYGLEIRPLTSFGYNFVVKRTV